MTTFACKHCGNLYSHQSSLYRHQSTCKVASSDFVPLVIPFVSKGDGTELDEVKHCIIAMQQENKAIQKENRAMQQQMKMMQQKILAHEETIKTLQTGMVINNVTNNNVDSTTNTIVINNYLQPNMSFISDQFMSKCFQKMGQGITDLTVQVYFNPEHPENHSIKANNITQIERHDRIQVHHNRVLQTMSAEYVLDQLWSCMFDKVDFHRADFEDVLKQTLGYQTFQQADKWFDFFRNIKKEDKEYKRMLKTLGRVIAENLLTN